MITNYLDPRMTERDGRETRHSASAQTALAGWGAKAPVPPSTVSTMGGTPICLRYPFRDNALTRNGLSRNRGVGD